MPGPGLCRKHGICSATFYKWQANYDGMDASIMSQMNALEDENRRLKRMFADDVGAPLYLAVHPFQWVRAGDPGPVFAWEGQAGGAGGCGGGVRRACGAAGQDAVD